jgi:hypothetical protein
MSGNFFGNFFCTLRVLSGIPVLLPLLKYSVCLILLCHSNPVWIPVSPLELLSHPSTRCEDNRYKVHTTLLA